MAEEDLNPEDQQEPESQGDPKDRQIAALERKLKQSQREGAFLKLRTKHNYITEDDFDGLFKGVPVEKWDAIAERIAPPAAPATEVPQGEPQPQATPDPQVVAEVTSVTKPLGGTQGKPKITFQEAKDMGGPSNPQVAQMIRDGLVEGVRFPG